MAELLSSASAWMTGEVIKVPSTVLSMPSRVVEVGLPCGSPAAGSAAPVTFMGGGPRTFPGGVSKWQWKRMQLKKSRQIEKARLMREKHVYEARRRAELIAATPELEMPWQKLSRVRPPNYVASDEQIKRLAARFQRRGAEDLWTEKDGPEKFEVMGDDDDDEDAGHARHASPKLSDMLMLGQDPEQPKSNAMRQRDEEVGGVHFGSTSQFQPLRDTPRIRPGSSSFPKRDLYKGGYRRPYS